MCHRAKAHTSGFGSERSQRGREKALEQKTNPERGKVSGKEDWAALRRGVGVTKANEGTSSHGTPALCVEYLGMKTLLGPLSPLQLPEMSRPTRYSVLT